MEVHIEYNMYKDYNVSREFFVETFKECDELLWDCGWSYLSDEFNCFYVSDTYYMVELDTGVIISYYKHLGRCNTCNFLFTEYQYKRFVNKLLEELKSS